MNQKKLLIGQSYFSKFDPKIEAAKQPYPPLGSMIAAALMQQKGYDVLFFDAMLATSEAEWGQRLLQHQPGIALLYEDNFNYLSKMCLLNMREAAFNMIRMAAESGATVIVAGSDASDQAALYLDAGADFVIRGEGEQTLTELVDYLENPGDVGPVEVRGITYRHNGELRVNPARPVLRDADALPFPAWDLIDVDRYRNIWLSHHGYFSMNVVTTRGCPYHCNWCAKPIWGQRYTSRSPENVVEELAWLHKTYQPDHIWFADDIMGLKPGWWQRFSTLLAEKNLRIPFKCLSRADLLVRENEDIDALARAGCEIVWIGAESGSQKILNAMEKGTTVEQIYAAAERLHQAGIKIAFFLQFGYPGEDWEDIRKTLKMVRDCRPDDIGISVSYPLPGTRFYDNVRLQLGSKQHWTDSADLDMMYQGSFDTAFYRQLHTVIHLEFRLRKGLRQIRGGLSRPGIGLFKESARAAYTLLRWPVAYLKLLQLRQRAGSQLDAGSHMSLEQAAQPSVQQEVS